MDTIHTGTRISMPVFAACKLFAQITFLSTLLLANGNAFPKLAVMIPTTGIQSCAGASATLKNVGKITHGIWKPAHASAKGSQRLLLQMETL
jgi:hypothetical protein